MQRASHVARATQLSIYLSITAFNTSRQLGKAAHEAALGRVDDAGLEVLDTIVKRFEATGYPDVTGLQGALVDQGNGAAAAYPGLDYIVRVEEERLP